METCVSHKIHLWNIYSTYIYHKFNPINPSFPYMDPMGIWKFWAPKIAEQKRICQEWESPDALEQHVRRGSVGAEEWKLDIITKCRYLDVSGS